MKQSDHIVGRYAPSPTGDLHLGNLRTALIAWLHCRVQQGTFLLRMEDLDLPRVVAGSADSIIEDLHWLGLDWDGEVVYQSQRNGFYQQAFDTLQSRGLIYPCFCSRRELQQIASAPHSAERVYPGLCQNLSSAEIAKRREHKAPAWRVRVNDQPITFGDQCHGDQREVLSRDVGDFVVLRADGLFAYQLAVVVDDLRQGVTQVVRGDDLISSTARQIYLQSLLEPDAPSIQYCHVPLLMDDEGRRMAKRDGSQSAREWRERGNTAQSLIARFAHQLGIATGEQELSATELLSGITFDELLLALSGTNA